MPYAEYQIGDTALQGGELTDFSRGVMQVRPGDRLPPGYYARGVNVEIRQGLPETRRGTRVLNWMRRANGQTLGTRFQAVREFRPSRSGTAVPVRLVLAIVDDALWRCVPNNVPVREEAALTSSTQPCEIIPGFNAALILRGLEQVPLIYDPYNQVPTGPFYGGSGRVRSLPSPASGNASLPAANIGCYHNDRYWLKKGYDQFLASALQEFDYRPQDVFRCESGGNGEIVQMIPYADNSIAVFKNDAVFRVTGTDGDLSELVVRQVWGGPGCIAGDTVVKIGDSVLYLAENGVARLRVTGDALVVEPVEAFSAAVAPTFKGLSWPAATAARAIVVDDYYLLAVPSKATWRQVDPLGTRWRGAEPIVPFDLGAVSREGTWQTFSEDYVVSGSEDYGSADWESFDETE
jgi:hypothetical protein